MIRLVPFLALLATATPAVAAEPGMAPRPPLLLAQAAPPAGSAPPAAAPTPAWESFPTMQLERVYRGPLKDTVVQRWRDTVDGSVCFLFIPISVPQLTQQVANPQYVQYGANGIGSISCVHPTQVVQLVSSARPGPAGAPPRVAEADPKAGAKAARLSAR